MVIKSVKDFLADEYPDVLTADGFDDAILGIVERYNTEPVVLYDKEKCLELLVAQGIEDSEDAMEYFYYNVIGSWVGDKTPCFATIINKKK